MGRSSCAVVALIAALTLTGSRAAAEPVTRGLAYSDLTALRLNPQGLQNQLELDLWWRLFDPGDSALLANNAFSVGIAPILSPASTRLGLTLKLRPLNVFKVEVRWEYLAWFGNFNLLQSFGSPRDDYSDSALDAGGEAGRNSAQDGWQLTLDAEARAKVGPVILRSRFKAGYIDVPLDHGDTVYYEQYYDLLLPSRGWFFLNDADVLVQIGSHLIVGARHSFASVAYPGDAYRPASPTGRRAAPFTASGPSSPGASSTRRARPSTSRRS
ncbi:MAG: hypothetical protein EP329_11210 [Deltaproteobacteria bacterium]|nr:MAG: hypothetical protein EP329_11210 [Deltaproteobacteria bacterium]